MDIDDVDTNDTIQKLKSLNICLWISKSITGTGVYALVPLATDNLTGHFEAINLLLQENGITLDPLKDATRLRYWSPPDDAVINIDVKPFEEIYEAPKDIKLYRGTKENSIKSLGETSTYDTGVYARTCHIKGLENASKNLKIEEGDIGQHLHTFIKYYHWAFNHYGISLQYAVNWCWNNFFKEHEHCKAKGHGIERIEQDFTKFYASYKDQHHIFDFERQKRSSLGEEKYDLHLKLAYGKKLMTEGAELELPLVSQKWIEDDFYAKDSENWNKYLLDSPTNSGKTSTFTKYFLKNKIKGLIVVPTQGALEQLHQDNEGSVVYYEKNKIVSFDDILICTTYASFEKLSQTIYLYDRFLVVDEFHNVVLSTSKEYRNRELNLILDHLDRFHLAVLMTGTNLKCHHPVIESFKKIKVTYENDPVKRLHLVYHSTKNLFSTVLSRVKKYSGLQVIYLDDKDEAGKLGKVINILKNDGYLDNEILLANADKKTDERFKSLIWTGKVVEGTRIIIATKIFVEALNLYNNVEAFHILSPIHGAYMQQLVTRPRNNQDCDVYLYWHENTLQSRDATFWFDQERHYQSQISLAKNLMVAFEETEWDDIHRKTFKANDVVRRKKISVVSNGEGLNDFNTTSYSFGLTYDYLNCDYLTQESQLLLYKTNPEQLFEYLKQYNWKVVTEETSNTGDDVINEKLLKDMRAKQESEMNEFINKIINDGRLENEDILDAKEYEPNSWQIDIRKKYAQLNNLISEENANYLLKRIRGEAREFKTLISQIQIRQALLYGSGDSREVAGQIFERFRIQTKWSSEDILKEINAIQKSSLAGAGKLPKMKTTTAATQFLNLYVETRRCKIPDPKGVPPKGRKQAVKNALLIVSHHPIRNEVGEVIEPIAPRSKGFEKRDKRINRNYRRSILLKSDLEILKQVNPDEYKRLGLTESPDDTITLTEEQKSTLKAMGLLSEDVPLG